MNHSREGLLVLGTLSNATMILGHEEMGEGQSRNAVYERALAMAEAATAQGRASHAFVIPYVGRFTESEHGWANPDAGGFTKNFAEPAADPISLNPSSGEQTAPQAEAEAQADPGTETIQANVENNIGGEAQEGEGQGESATTQDETKKGEATSEPKPKPAIVLGKSK